MVLPGSIIDSRSETERHMRYSRSASPACPLVKARFPSRSFVDGSLRGNLLARVARSGSGSGRLAAVLRPPGARPRCRLGGTDLGQLGRGTSLPLPQRRRPSRRALRSRRARSARASGWREVPRAGPLRPASQSTSRPGGLGPSGGSRVHPRPHHALWTRVWVALEPATKIRALLMARP